MNPFLRKSCAAVALSTMLQPGCLFAQTALTANPPISIAPKSNAMVAAHTIRPEIEAKLTDAQKLVLLKKNVKHVFVLFQENRAFDFYFGTYPGANGLFSKPGAKTLGFNQPIVNADGTVSTISPFLIPTTVTDVNSKVVPIYPADTASVDHSHAGMDNDLDVDSENVVHNDRYALNAEGLTIKNGSIVSLKTGLPATTAPTLAQKQTAEVVMGHVDCNAAPILWNYADRFALFDNFF